MLFPFLSHFVLKFYWIVLGKSYIFRMSIDVLLVYFYIIAFKYITYYTVSSNIT